MRRREKAQTRQEKPRRLRTYSFAVAFGIIVIIVAGSYYQSLPTVEHIPDSFEFKSQEWMPYIPANVLYVGYVNYRQAYAVSKNLTLFGTAELVQFSQIGFDIAPTDITYEIEIQLPEPQYSGSTAILQLDSVQTAVLVNDLASVNLTRIHPPLNYDGYTVYELLMRKFGDQSFNLGYITVVNGHVIMSNDKTTALQDVEAILDQFSSGAKGLFDDVTVRRAVYATGVTDQSYVGLYVGMFATQLNDTRMAVKSIVGNGDSILVSRALLFPSSDIALARLDEAHKVYRNAATYRILDSWLVVTYDYPLGRMQTELVGI